MVEKEKRTEYVGLYLTPELAKQVKEADNNKELQDKLLKKFVTDETEWLKEEIQNMDDITLIYRAKLLTIKDNFSKVQDVYVDEISNLCSKTYESFTPINNHFEKVTNKLKEVVEKVEGVSKTISDLTNKLGYIDYSRLERLLDAIDRFNKMSESEKKLIELLLQK